MNLNMNLIYSMLFQEHSDIWKPWIKIWKEQHVKQLKWHTMCLLMLSMRQACSILNLLILILHDQYLDYDYLPWLVIDLGYMIHMLTDKHKPYLLSLIPKSVFTTSWFKLKIFRRAKDVLFKFKQEHLIYSIRKALSDWKQILYIGKPLAISMQQQINDYILPA